MHVYLTAKFLHILVAIIALGTSAGLGIVLELFGNHPVHGRFVLGAIQKMERALVMPGYVLMLATGVWLAKLTGRLSERWIHAALLMWCIGMFLLVAGMLVLGKQIALLDSEGASSPSYHRTSTAGRALGAGFGLAVIGMLYLMVFKPALS